MLHKLPTPLLRLQLVKRLAEASGFAQQEVERLCELKSFMPAAPAKAKRTAPSLTRNLLRIVLHKPALATQLPPDLLPETPERAALIRLHLLLLEHGTEYLHVIVTSRARSGLPLSRMMMRDELVEIDMDANPAAARRLSVLSLPTTFIFDADGRQRYRASGVPKAADLRTALEPLLA